MRVCGRVKCVRPKGFKQDIEHLSGVILAPGNVAKQPDANAALCLWGIMFAWAVTYIYWAFLHIRLNESGLYMSTHTHTDTTIINTNIPDAHTQTSRTLFAGAQKLTRLASKQASESVMNLFSLAPRSRGRGLIRGRGFFCRVLCMWGKEKFCFRAIILTLFLFCPAYS